MQQRIVVLTPIRDWLLIFPASRMMKVSIMWKFTMAISRQVREGEGILATLQLMPFIRRQM